LITLQGGVSILEKAAQLLPDTMDIQTSLAQLAVVVSHLEKQHSEVNIHIDLADVFGYRYHTGLKYSAYIDGRGRTVAQGGRYDYIGETFGRSRPATGFSADLKSLVKLG